jgi:hypothetical protein
MIWAGERKTQGGQLIDVFTDIVYDIYHEVLMMKTLNVAISEVEYNKFGIKTDVLDFSYLVDMIHKELIRQNLNECVTLAAKYGLSSMSMDEITDEVSQARLTRAVRSMSNV